MNPDIYAEKMAPLAKRKPNTASAVKKPATKKTAPKKTAKVRDDAYLEDLDPKTRRLVIALERLYGTRPYP